MGGLTSQAPRHLIDWQGRSWTPDDAGERPAAHPNSRFCTPIRQCPTLSPSFDDPAGVPIDAIIFGGRRRDTLPLVLQSRDWQHGVFLGATLSSETTAAATGAVGVVRRDPMAMLPFVGYHVGDYLRHWIELGRQHPNAQLPPIFHVNWFRRSADGEFLWPGFGENSRVLTWIVERLEGKASAVDTLVGLVPVPDGIDVTGLAVEPDDLAAALAVDEDEWRSEVVGIREWFDRVGTKLPAALRTELDDLSSGLGLSH